MQTLSFRPTTTTSGAPPGVQKGSLDLQPSSMKARPSSATVQQRRPAQVQIAQTVLSLQAAVEI